jgi:hypothetical protein
MMLATLLLAIQVSLPQRQPPPLYTVKLVQSCVTGFGKRKPRLLGLIPHGSPTFTMTMEDGDSFGTVLGCMNKVRKRGGGICQIEAHSLRPSRHNKLYRKYANVGVTVLPEQH